MKGERLDAAAKFANDREMKIRSIIFNNKGVIH
jgi:hypothetical protein